MGCRLFTAVDGADTGAPSEWKGTPGAWGCSRSHAAVIEQALADGTERLLVFEDDATFVPGFSGQLDRLTVPEDCQMLYLGGEHLAEPLPGPPGLVRGVNVNRTHAYGILGRPAMLTILEHLRWDPATWTAAHSIDHHLGILHEQGRVVVYAASPWLSGQAAGRSDVDGKTWPDRSWQRG